MQRVQQATVYIRVTLSDGTRASGSGFFGTAEARHIVLTNAHVVGMLDPNSRRPKEIEVFVNSGEPNERKLTARVLGVDRDSDLAVLDVDSRTPGLPEPLVVRSASHLSRLDDVWVFGFPLGERLGKEITIRPSSVSALRKNPNNGQLERIQVNGGMDPGNSGGPVVDAGGHVVGVAVSGIPGRMINFAIPGERVHTILNGRISSLGVGQPFVNDQKQVGLPVRMEMIDPRNFIKETALEVWVGDPPPSGKPGRPPATKEPAAEPGDTPHQRVPLAYDARRGEATGEVLLPELPAGKAYWLQAVWVNAAGETHWAAAHTHVLKEQPVERRPVNLTVRHQKTTRGLTLTVRNTFRVGSDADTELLAMETKAYLTEQVSQASAAGALVTLRYRDETSRDVVEDRRSRPSQLLEKVRPYLNALRPVLRLDVHGNLIYNDVPPQGLQGVPADLAADLRSFHEPIKQALDTMAIPLPNKTVAPGERWKARRSLPIPLKNRDASGQVAMTYTYLGQRRRDGRDEAVIAVEGDVEGGKGKDLQLGGRATGTVLVDLGTGQVREANVRVVLDLDAAASGIGIQSVRLLATLQVALKRNL
jgi:S1-C subfamily serine protease